MKHSARASLVVSALLGLAFAACSNSEPRKPRPPTEDPDHDAMAGMGGSSGAGIVGNPGSGGITGAGGLPGKGGTGGTISPADAVIPDPGAAGSPPDGGSTA